MSRYILGIESSCDDTSIALLEIKTKKVIGCITKSSQEIQNQFGGVVPELAARKHEDVFLKILAQLLEEHSVSFKDIGYIAYTQNPGLANCLFVGIVLAKTLSKIFNIPAIPVNHVYGHVFSHGLTDKVVFPFISLVVSGKTTAIYYVEDQHNILLLEETRDNALGEAYDKVGRYMGLPYPAGKYMDELFDETLKTDRLLNKGLPVTRVFSYSGIITAGKKKWDEIKKDSSIENPHAYMSTCFQRYVIDNLSIKIKYWSDLKSAWNISISGGVAANTYLRKKLSTLNLNVSLVDRKYAGDNAAMVAYYALWILPNP